MPLAIICDPAISMEPVLSELERQGVSCELKENNGQLELWVSDPALVSSVGEYYQAYCRSQKSTMSAANLKNVPITTGILLVTALVALITGLGEARQEWFLMAHMQYYPRDWFLYGGWQSVWRAISPVFLHFSIEHLIFNALSFWYLGNLLERATGKVFFVVLVLVLSVVGNVSQLLISGPLFGGLSGVVYGFIGFACVYQMTQVNLGIPKGLFYLAGIWLLLGVSGIFSSLGLFSVANAAHVGGLLSGLVMSAIFVALNKLKTKSKK